MKIVSNNSLFYLEEDILFKGPSHRPHARGWDQFNKLTYKFTSNCKLFTSIFASIFTHTNTAELIINAFKSDFKNSFTSNFTSYKFAYYIT